MPSWDQGDDRLGAPRWVAGLWVAASLMGCATPGPPKAPSLQIPETVTGLETVRRGDAVELGFDLPTGTVDGMPYRGKGFHAAVCRAVESGACLPVAGLTDVALPAGSQGRASLRDVLPAELAAGPARLLTYRVRLSSDRGRTAGYGNAAYAAAGVAPAPVGGLRAEGSRQGVAVRWSPAGSGPSTVVLRRETVDGFAASSKAAAGRGPSGKKNSGAEESGVVWLSTSPKPDPLGPGVPTASPVRGGSGVLDDGAAVGSTYRYTAERQLTVQLGGHGVVLHSALSTPVEVTLRAVYPPPAPIDLAGTRFALPPRADGKTAGAAVDLIWTPADDDKTLGYSVVRTVITPGHPEEHSSTKLNDAPVKTPSFHDLLPTDLAGVVLRYDVRAVDANGLESQAATVVVEK